jgi:DNA repair protein RecO (recombination protein O)
MERTNGLIIKQSDYGEGNRMLTVFTEDFGIIKAAVYGIKRAKSRQSAASQFLSWAEFMLYFGKGEVASVNSVTSMESFFPIQEDLEKLALSSYLADITYYAQNQNVPNIPLLRMLLNTLFVCAYRDVPTAKTKAVYELRLAADMGYMPVLTVCAACGEECEPEFFSCECGGAVCRRCHSVLRDDLPMSRPAYYAVRYILSADLKKVFSFEVSDEVLREVGNISEKYLLYRMERKFSSLDYLKNILT